MRLKTLAIVAVLLSSQTYAHAEVLPLKNSEVRCEGAAVSDLTATQNKILLMMDAAAVEAFGKNYGTLVKEYTGLNISPSDLLKAQKAFFSQNENQVDSVLSQYVEKGDHDKIERFSDISWTVLKTTAFMKRLAKEFYTEENYKKTLSMLNDVKAQVISAIEPHITDKKLFKKISSEIRHADLSWLDEKTIVKNSQKDGQFGVSVVSYDLLESHPLLSLLMVQPSGLFEGGAANMPLEEEDHYALAILPPFFQTLDEGSALVLAHELGHILPQNIMFKPAYEKRIQAYGACALRSTYPTMDKAAFEDLVTGKAGELIADAVATWTIQKKGAVFSNRARNIFCAKASMAPWEDDIEDEHAGVRIRYETLFTGKCQL